MLRVEQQVVNGLDAHAIIDLLSALTQPLPKPEAPPIDASEKQPSLPGEIV